MNAKINGKLVLLMALALSLIATSATTMVRTVAAPAGDRTMPLIHVYLYYPTGAPQKVDVFVKMNNDIPVGKRITTANHPMEAKVISGVTHWGAEIEMKLPMRTRGLLDLFQVCTVNVTTKEKRCEFPYVWWDNRDSDAWIRVYNTK